MEDLKNIIAGNIGQLRRQANMTQIELAERLNYSDKAVSKWERGESIPDILTLMELAQLFDVTVDDLLKDHNALPENVGKVLSCSFSQRNGFAKTVASGRFLAENDGFAVENNFPVCIFLWITCGLRGKLIR